MSFLWPRVESAFKFTSNLLLIIENKLHVDVTVCAVFDMLLKLQVIIFSLLETVRRPQLIN